MAGAGAALSICAVPTTAPDAFGTELSDGLLALLADAERGPRRDGLYALWLTGRAASDMVLGVGGTERTQAKRLAALEHRLSSLTLPAPLRRGLVAALSHLREAAGAGGALALGQLVAPVRDSLGAPASDVLARAARAARAFTTPTAASTR